MKRQARSLERDLAFLRSFAKSQSYGNAQAYLLRLRRIAKLLGVVAAYSGYDEAVKQIYGNGS